MIGLGEVEHGVERGSEVYLLTSNPRAAIETDSLIVVAVS